MEKSGFLWLIQRIKSRFPSANGFLDNADWELSENRLTIRLYTGGASYLNGCAQYIKDLAQEEFELNLVVDITESSTAPDAGEENEKLRRQAIEQASVAAAAGDKPKKKKVENKGDLILGRVVAGKRVNMSELTLESGKVSVTGEVFAVNHKEIKGRGAWVLSFDMTDYTGSVRVNQFMRASTGGDRQGRGRSFGKDEIIALLDAIKPGMYLTVQGRIVSNRFDEDIVLEPDNIFKEKKEERMDSSPDKRVELHLHTRMSAMDGLTDTKLAVARAREVGTPRHRDYRSWCGAVLSGGDGCAKRQGYQDTLWLRGRILSTTWIFRPACAGSLIQLLTGRLWRLILKRPDSTPARTGLLKSPRLF